MDEHIKRVVMEFQGVRIDKAVVHDNEALHVLLDKILENGIFKAEVKRRRQGKRGSRSARNYLLRKALWWARSYEYVNRPPKKSKDKKKK